jgi:methylenetetrahydrofolate dehydrogenase (NADP+) / methenyltetrahydrofolate cyclohydrolase
MPIVVDGKKIAADILAEVRAEVAKMRQKPELTAILVGNDAASISYLNQKRKRCEEVGIGFTLLTFPEDITTSKLRKYIYKARSKGGHKAIILQLPLPSRINTQYILDSVMPSEDADVLSSRSKGLLVACKSPVIPPTAAAVLEILQVHNISLAAHCVIVGMGLLVGKPLSWLLADKTASLALIHSKTPDIARFTKEADILIAGTGQPGLISGDMVKSGVVAMDAGYSKMDAKVVGDIDFDSVAPKASLITPVPGGIGPVTVAMLLKNVVTLAKLKNKKQETRNK